MNIILITHQRLLWLQECLESVLKSLEKAQVSNAQIFVGCNADPEAYSWISSLKTSSYPIHVFSWEALHPPSEARNLLLREIPPGWTLFLDDDTAVPIFYFERFLNLEKGDAQIIGGPNLNFPSSSECEDLQQVILGSVLISGPFAWRYSRRSAHRRPWVSTFVLCHLWIEKKKETPFYFDKDFVGGEENDLLDRLRPSSFLYHPDLFVYHHRRADIESFAQQAFKFGIGRGQFLKRKSKTLARLLSSLTGIGVQVSKIYLRFATALLFLTSDRKHSYRKILRFSEALQLNYLKGVSYAVTRTSGALREDFKNSSLPKAGTSKGPRSAASL